MQKNTMTVTDVEAARALRDVPFLGNFLEPASPSDVAKSLGIAANLVHHHAKRCLELGLLFEVKRQNRKVFYQLSARVFEITHGLLEFEDFDGAYLHDLTAAFQRANERSARISTETSPAILSFDPAFIPHATTPSGDPTTEHRPAHAQTVTIKLRPSSYRELVIKIATLLSEIKPEHTDDAVHCTIGLLAFEGALHETVAMDDTESYWISSHIPGVPIRNRDLSAQAVAH
jgi:DNA-binding transcriptional ArsR family regulator